MWQSNDDPAQNVVAGRAPRTSKKRKMRIAGLAAMALFLTLADQSASGGGFGIQANASYFRPSDSAFKEIYGNSAVFGGEMSIALSKGLRLWVGGSCISRQGKLTLSGEPTELKIYPLFAGLKFFAAGPAVSPYIGLAAGYFLYEETNPLGSVKEGAAGFIGQAGISFKLLRPLSVDIFARYSICKIKPFELEADLGGFAAGLGLGFDF